MRTLYHFSNSDSLVAKFTLDTYIQHTLINMMNLRTAKSRASHVQAILVLSL